MRSLEDRDKEGAELDLLQPVPYIQIRRIIITIKECLTHIRSSGPTINWYAAFITESFSF
jgi:hypothetical protein